MMLVFLPLGLTDQRRSSMWFVPKKVGGRACEYMYAKATYNVLSQSRTVQKGGSNPQLPGKAHPEEEGGIQGRINIFSTHLTLLPSPPIKRDAKTEVENNRDKVM